MNPKENYELPNEYLINVHRASLARTKNISVILKK